MRTMDAAGSPGEVTRTFETYFDPPKTPSAEPGPFTQYIQFRPGYPAPANSVPTSVQNILDDMAAEVVGQPHRVPTRPVRSETDQPDASRELPPLTTRIFSLDPPQDPYFDRRPQQVQVEHGESAPTGLTIPNSIAAIVVATLTVNTLMLIWILLWLMTR